MTSHVIAYQSMELLFGMHTFNFNCFFDDLIVYLRKYAAYLGCCKLYSSPIIIQSICRNPIISMYTTKAE